MKLCINYKEAYPHEIMYKLQGVSMKLCINYKEAYPHEIMYKLQGGLSP